MTGGLVTPTGSPSQANRLPWRDHHPLCGERFHHAEPSACRYVCPLVPPLRGPSMGYSKGHPVRGVAGTEVLGPWCNYSLRPAKWVWSR